MGNYYNYKRISTDTEKQTFARQEKALKKYADQNNIEYIVEFTEAKSAKNFTDRKEFNKLDKLINRDDTVVLRIYQDLLEKLLNCKDISINI